MKQELIFDLLNRALEEEIGLAVECNNPKVLSQELNECTKGLEKYSSVMVCIPSLTEHVFLTKRSVDLEEVSL